MASLSRLENKIPGINEIKYITIDEDEKETETSIEVISKTTTNDTSAVSIYLVEGNDLEGQLVKYSGKFYILSNKTQGGYYILLDLNEDNLMNYILATMNHELNKINNSLGTNVTDAAIENDVG